MNASSIPAPRRTSMRHGQRGTFMLEALISILIIAFGVLGLVGLQAQSMRHVNDAQMRAEAAFYASTAAANMWTYDPNTVKTYFGASGAGYTNWKDQITAAVTGLPDAAAKPPTITFDDAAVNSMLGVVATISVNWRYPGETDFHNYSTQAVIGTNIPPP